MADNKKLSQLRKQKKELQEKDVSNTTMHDFSKRIREEERINDLIEERIDLNKKILKDEEDYVETLASVGKQLGKNSQYTKEFSKQQDAIKLQLSGITSILNDTKTLTKEQIENAEETAAAYKKGQLGLQSAFAELVKNKDANVDIEKIINEQIKAQKEFANSITDTTGDAGKLKAIFEANVEQLQAMGPALKAAAKDMKALQKQGEALSGTPLGGIINQGLGISKAVTGKGPGSIGDIAKGLADKRGAAAIGGKAAGGLVNGISAIARFAGPAALIATAAFGIFKWVDGGGPQKLSAALTMMGGDTMMDEKSIKDKAASLEGTEEFRKINAKYNYIKPLEERQTREKELFDWSKSNYTSMVEYENSLVKDELNFQMGLKKDAINFGFQQAMQTMEAEAARRKSLYLTAMTQYKSGLTVSERALNAIGSSTDAVLESVKELGAQLGTSLLEQVKMATSAQGLAKLYQTSGTEVLKMSRNFRLMDKSSAKTAFNNIAGVTAFAELNEISPGELFKQMSEASEDILKYSNMTTSQYASQAVLLSNMNVSMKDMATASGTMVLNYKDSIKSEMSLSAMLGKNVNLSEVRARLMSGDMAGGASALKSALGGVDIGSMNAFQKQALSQSTGMGIEQLLELTQSKGGGVKGTLQEKAGLKTGEDIAKGALKMDVSLAGQRLGMEQAQRKEMLKFEQRERLIMLQLEQAQKLKMLEVEAYWRVKWTKEYEMKNEKEMAAAKHLEEMGSGIMMGGGKNLTDQAFKGLEGSAGAAKGVELNSMVSNMVKEGRVSSGDMRLAEYYNAQFELAETYKNQPDILAKKLEETYSKIFKDEADARAKDLAQVEANKQAAIKIEELKKQRSKVADGYSIFDELFSANNTEANKKILEQEAAIDKQILELQKQINTPITSTAGVNGPVVQSTGTPTGTTTTTTAPTTTTTAQPAAATNFGDIGKILERIATSTNNTVIDLNNLYTKTSEVGNALITNGNTSIGQIEKMVTWIDTGHQNNFVKMNEELEQIKTISTNGYTELLKRTDATNQLLDTLIGATAEAAAKPINISGKRVSDVMRTVSSRVYGITGA